jgi:hypothetical protein
LDIGDTNATHLTDLEALEPRNVAIDVTQDQTGEAYDCGESDFTIIYVRHIWCNVAIA